MFIRHRLLQLEAGQVIVGAALMAIALTFVITYVGNFYTDAQTPNASQQERRGSLQYQADCSDQRDANLCAQWRAAIAAEKAADATVAGNWISGAAAALSFASLVAVALSLWQTRTALGISRSEFESARQEASETLRISEETLAASQRPWVKVGIEIASPYNIIDGDCHVTVKLAMTNAGNAPAIGAWVHAMLRYKPIDVSENLRDLFEYARKNFSGGIILGHVLFPNDTHTGTYSLLIDRTVIQSFAHSVGMKFEDIQVVPDILFCAFYISPIDKKVHETGYVYHLRQKAKSHLEAAHSFGMGDPEVPQHMLGVFPSILGSYAT